MAKGNHEAGRGMVNGARWWAWRGHERRGGGPSFVSERWAGASRGMGGGGQGRGGGGVLAVFAARRPRNALFPLIHRAPGPSLLHNYTHCSVLLPVVLAGLWHQMAVILREGEIKIWQNISQISY